MKEALSPAIPDDDQVPIVGNVADLEPSTRLLRHCGMSPSTAVSIRLKLRMIERKVMFVKTREDAGV